MEERVSDIMSPIVGDRFDFEAGAIRIDEVTTDQVYFVRWRHGEEVGEPCRMALTVWREAVRRYQTRNDEP